MARTLSRRSVTAYVAEELLKGNKAAIMQLAGYLVQTRRTRQLQLYVRDIEAVITASGHALADVTVARKLTADTKLAIEKFVTSQTGARTVAIRETIDPAVLGGVRLRLPGLELNTTLAHQLTVFKTRFKKA